MQTCSFPRRVALLGCALLGCALGSPKLSVEPSQALTTVCQWPLRPQNHTSSSSVAILAQAVSVCQVHIAMDVGDLRRITVSADPSAFPYTQGYIEVALQRIWWDLRFLHQILCKSGEGRVLGLDAVCCRLQEVLNHPPIPPPKVVWVSLPQQQCF